MGGPFRLGEQAHADGRLLRSWRCPCRTSFVVPAGAERLPTVQGNYLGFTVEHQGQLFQVCLKEIRRQETLWSVAGMTVAVSALAVPGPRAVTLTATGEAQPRTASFRIQAEGAPPDIARRLRAKGGIDGQEELVAEVLHRIWH